MIKKAIKWKKRQQFQKQAVCQWGLHAVLNWHFAHFHIPSTRYSLLQLESTNYPNWRQMLLERLQQSLHKALHTRCTERGEKHPAFPTPAHSDERQRHKEHPQKEQAQTKDFQPRTQSIQGTKCMSELLPPPLSADGIKSMLPSVVRSRVGKYWWKTWNYLCDNLHGMNAIANDPSQTTGMLEAASAVDAPKLAPTPEESQGQCYHPGTGQKSKTSHSRSSSNPRSPEISVWPPCTPSIRWTKCKAGWLSPSRNKLLTSTTTSSTC